MGITDFIRRLSSTTASASGGSEDPNDNQPNSTRASLQNRNQQSTTSTPQNRDQRNEQGNPLSNQPSSPSEKGLAALRKALSSLASKESTPDNDDDKEDSNDEPKVPPLIPPNYKNAFELRTFPFTANFPRSSWAEQLIAVPDNGIRQELSDMYSIFADMERRPTMLTADDVSLFVQWFTAFLTSLEELFYLEEQCLYPWINATDHLSEEHRKWGTSPTSPHVKGALSAAKRMRCKGDIIRLGNGICSCERLFERRPIAECLPILADAVAPFVDELSSYIDLKRDLLPSIIHGHLRQKDRMRFERNYWDMARAQPAHKTTIVLATRWMDRSQMRKWKAKYFGPRKGLYGKWKTEFMEDHCAIVTELADRVQMSELERIKQIEDNQTARARVQQGTQFMPSPVEYTDSEPQSELSSSCASEMRRSNMSLSAAFVPATA